MYEFSTDVVVRYAETDAMGIVHHSAYVPWLEVSRLEMVKHLGIPYQYLEKQGVGLPLVGLEVKFRNPAKFGDTLQVTTHVKEVPSTPRLTLHYTIRRGQDKILTAKTEHAFVINGQISKPTEEFTSAFLAQMNPT